LFESFVVTDDGGAVKEELDRGYGEASAVVDLGLEIGESG
jgi:hypothetical protein